MVGHMVGSHTCPSDVHSPCAHTRTSLVASDYLVDYLNLTDIIKIVCLVNQWCDNTDI